MSVLLRGAVVLTATLATLAVTRANVQPSPQQSLFRALTTGDLSTVKMELNGDRAKLKCAFSATCDPTGLLRSPLHVAAEAGQENVVLWLANQRDTILDLPDARGWMPRHCAAWHCPAVFKNVLPSRHYSVSEVMELIAHVCRAPVVTFPVISATLALITSDDDDFKEAVTEAFVCLMRRKHDDDGFMRRKHEDCGSVNIALDMILDTDRMRDNIMADRVLSEAVQLQQLDAIIKLRDKGIFPGFFAPLNCPGMETRLSAVEMAGRRGDTQLLGHLLRMASKPSPAGKSVRLVLNDSMRRLIREIREGRYGNLSTLIPLYMHYGEQLPEEERPRKEVMQFLRNYNLPDDVDGANPVTRGVTMSLAAGFLCSNVVMNNVIERTGEDVWAALDESGNTTIHLIAGHRPEMLPILLHRHVTGESNAMSFSAELQKLQQQKPLMHHVISSGCQASLEEKIKAVTVLNNCSSGFAQHRNSAGRTALQEGLRTHLEIPVLRLLIEAAVKHGDDPSALLLEAMRVRHFPAAHRILDTYAFPVPAEAFFLALAQDRAGFSNLEPARFYLLCALLNCSEVNLATRDAEGWSVLGRACAYFSWNPNEMLHVALMLRLIVCSSQGAFDINAPLQLLHGSPRRTVQMHEDALLHRLARQSGKPDDNLLVMKHLFCHPQLDFGVKNGDGQTACELATRVANDRTRTLEIRQRAEACRKLVTECERVSKELRKMMAGARSCDMTTDGELGPVFVTEGFLFPERDKRMLGVFDRHKLAISRQVDETQLLLRPELMDSLQEWTRDRNFNMIVMPVFAVLVFLYAMYNGRHMGGDT